MARGDVDRWIEGDPDATEARQTRALRPEDIRVGAVYRAKRPRRRFGYFWVTALISPSVPIPSVNGQDT